MVPPQLTRCCTQAGEAAAVGWMTCAASPPAILGCACKIPSRIQINPNPTRSSPRPRASRAPARSAPASAGPGAGRRQARAVAQASPRKTMMSSAIAPWCSSADLNAATSVGSAGFRPEFMPGTAFSVTRDGRGRTRTGPNMKKM